MSGAKGLIQADAETPHDQPNHPTRILLRGANRLFSPSSLEASHATHADGLDLADTGRTHRLDCRAGQEAEREGSRSRGGGPEGEAGDRPPGVLRGPAENTLASYRRAIEAGATVGETDVRTTKDNELVCCHDADLARTTDGKGLIRDRTLAEIKKLDAGSRFDPKYKDERIPTLREVLQLCKGKMHVMLDLKESGAKYAKRITAEVRKHGEAKEIVLGIRSVEQARLFRELLPEARRSD